MTGPADPDDRADVTDRERPAPSRRLGRQPVDGGGNQQVALLHVSLNEYLTIVSCPVPNGGFSGRYRTEIHDFIIDGELPPIPPSARVEE